MVSVYMNSILLSKLSVYSTTEVKEMSDVHKLAVDIVDAYVELNPKRKFSYRILLPRSGDSNSLARKLGLAVQGEILLTMKKHRLKPSIKEIRYLHDEAHYGWLLMDPDFMDDVIKG
jgi:hypothetical protein